MKLLLDTHILFWLIAEPHRLTLDEISAVEMHESAASAVSIWEFRLKWLRRADTGKPKGPIDPAVLLDALNRRDLLLLSLSPADAAAVLDPPLSHTDPFDELLLAQAQAGGYRLLTRDRKLADHPVAFTA